MPVCSIVKTITPRCRGRPDALLHEADLRKDAKSNGMTLLYYGEKVRAQAFSLLQLDVIEKSWINRW